jgi:hypothetical protein
MLHLLIARELDHAEEVLGEGATSRMLDGQKPASLDRGSDVAGKVEQAGRDEERRLADAVVRGA